ncbi:MFS general substrate transporter [Schizopora paradoxa]|uniref:MFS general substrate transporter n=1 Tax=Schizopora paradoxa TaxID=27342 RepID=A0A0H2RLK2_9AGAM|nr:MFS general substrate transporter [Schizopora paradoxa]
MNGNKPWGLQWRSSIWFVTLGDALHTGIATDLTVYSIIIPVIPFQLQHLGYHSVSSLTAWLLFSFVKIFTATPPISWLSERYNSRRFPLLCGLGALIGSIILFMEAPNYAVMVLARVLQGISSSTIWIVGLALLCDTVPEKRVGQQLGLAAMGFTFGVICAPPIGGALFQRFGFRGPFIFDIIIAFVDLVGRLLVIEKKDASKWEIADSPSDVPSETQNKEPKIDIPPTELPVQNIEAPSGIMEGVEEPTRVSSMKVLKLMLQSSRTTAGLTIVVIYAIAFTMFEPTLPLRLQDVWNFDSSKVGLVYLVCAGPTIISSPLSGWIADRFGVEWITVMSVFLAIPWYFVLFIKSRLALFLVALAMSNFFLSSLISPLMSELASITRAIDGVGYAHIYGAFNLAFGVGSTVGPLTAGQIYDHSKSGWLIICCIGAGLMCFALVLSVIFTGEKPLWIRYYRRSISL